MAAEPDELVQAPKNNRTDKAASAKIRRTEFAENAGLTMELIVTERDLAHVTNSHKDRFVY